MSLNPQSILSAIFPRTLFVLLGKELRGFFLSPIAYVVLGLVMMLGAFSFTAALTDPGFISSWCSAVPPRTVIQTTVTRVGTSVTASPTCPPYK